MSSRFMQAPKLKTKRQRKIKLVWMFFRVWSNWCGTFKFEG